MTKLHDFYFLSEVNGADGQINCKVSFHQDHQIFKGHFPNQAVVPGVCTLAIVTALLEQATGHKLRLEKAGNMKFLQLLLPAHQPQVVVAYKPKETGFSVSATFTLEEKAVFKMQAMYVDRIKG